MDTDQIRLIPIPDLDELICKLIDPVSLLSLSEVNRHYAEVTRENRSLFERVGYDLTMIVESRSMWLLKHLVDRASKEYEGISYINIREYSKTYRVWNVREYHDNGYNSDGSFDDDRAFTPEVSSWNDPNSLFSPLTELMVGGNEAIEIACKRGYVEIVTVLIDYATYAFAFDDYPSYDEYITEAIANGHLDVLKLFAPKLGQGKIRFAFFQAVLRNQTKIIEYLLSLELSNNAYIDRRCLEYIHYNPSEEIAPFLRDHGFSFVTQVRKT